MNRRRDYPAAVCFASAICLILFAVSIYGTPPSTVWGAEPRVQGAYGNLPLVFESNRGQTDNAVSFLSRGPGFTLWLTPTEAVYGFSSVQPRQVDGRQAEVASEADLSRLSVLKMRLAGANAVPRIVGRELDEATVNYFIGNDPNQWRTKIPTYRKVQYQDIYPGIDLIYYGDQRQLEYDFVLAPGADPSAIVLAFEGAEGLAVDAHGNLLISNPAWTVRLNKPVIYQQMDGIRKPIAGGYLLRSDKNQVAFQIASYDRGLPLIIDPVLSYSTYLGGNNADRAGSVSVDSTGHAYVTGQTASSNFPTTVGVFQGTSAGASDSFVTKLNPTGTGLVYSTYIGGANGDFAASIALDTSGNVYVTGSTSSTNFPVTAGAFQSGFAGGPRDTFVAKFNPSGTSLMYSTYLGGTEDEEAGAIAVDGMGNAYVTGAALANFPATAGAFSTTFLSGDAEIFVTKLNAAGTGLLYSTAIPGAHPGTDGGRAIVVDTSGNAYVSGVTRAGIGSPGAFQTAYQGGISDGFVLKLNASGSSLVYATNLGGSDIDEANSLTIDAAGNAYVGGGTRSPNFPTTSGVLQATFAGGVGVAQDTFVAKLSPTGSALVFSTFLGGNGEETSSFLALDSPTGIIYVTLGTRSTNMPVTLDALQPTPAGGFDVYIAKINPTASAVLYGSYFGGSGHETTTGVAIALDFFGNAYVASNTFSTNLPTTAGAFQTGFGGIEDGFVAKFTFNTPVTIDIKPGSYPNSINLGSQGTVPVAILGSATFDASQVDPLTVTLADAQVKLKGKGTPMASLEDVNNDGFVDMVVHVSTEALQINANDTDATVGGSTVGGTPFRGKDSVRVVPEN